MTRQVPGAPILVDLFSGCGGFSLGAHRAGYRVAAAFDNDPILTSSYTVNFPDTRLFLKDVTQLSGADIRAAAGGRVDGIFGGPPCQGFSDIGLRDPADPRRQLIDHFFRLVQEVEPSFFVMENVRGLAYEDTRFVLDSAMDRVRGKYSLLGPCIWDASLFGAATKRARLFVIGVLKDRGDTLTSADIDAEMRPPATVRAAISDLKYAVPVSKDDGYDVWRISAAGRASEYASRLRAGDGLFTGHRSTAHTQAVIERFQSVPQGGVDPVGRHPRLKWTGQCPTLRAGTGADRGSYQSVRPIHPELPRVISVREAARLQGFPDSHLFHPTVWHSFRMIGNSVSPIIAEAIFRTIARKLYKTHLSFEPQIAHG
ncbi:DNA cytosine methyltransferase [Mesorhizobium sophorae]|uniref:DNA cytosine methyltransferase n=1 Tax=Mesorhizobium sophorae TaxID=1300294 RepID=UPI000BA2C9C4|nr:DNA cytosine methyltransferase [Mesorhizobium sophorae]